ncbi:MAG: gliding motility-associated C-terminal domain-containing protein [Chitinophagales bacterium]|nr:gliding motility-associated C-terminal domain-containing protein [Chitinophagales bacterium]
MYRRLVLLAAFLFLLLSCFTANATHIFGGELLYTHIVNNTYRVTLTLYGDCTGQSFPKLYNAQPSVYVYNSGILTDSLFLDEDTTQRKEVSPVCPGDEGKTACKDINGTLPGVTKFVFTTTASLPPSADWRLAFTGQMNNGTQAGRSVSISNISVGAGSGQLMYLEAILNNRDGHNSSPRYTSIPTPFFCINKSQQYNQGAVDPDNDSLAFSLIPALVGNSSASVKYISSFSGAQPLATLSGTFSYSALSGQMRFVPDQIQRSLVVNKVEEYKNGKLVGSSMREMTFIVLDYCHNTAPEGTVDTTSLTGGGIFDNIINVCVNTPKLSFTIPARDVDNDNILVTLNNLPNGATATVTSNNGHAPLVNFSWNTANIPVGNYNLFVTYTDDACPLYGSQTIAYTIRVVNPISIVHETLQPTNCLFREHIGIKVADGILPRKITIVNNNNNIILGTYIDTSGYLTDSFRSGSYTIYAESEALRCKTSYIFTVEDRGTYPIPPEHNNPDLCLNDPLEPLYVLPANNAEVKWYSVEGGLLKQKPVYETKDIATYQWLVSQQVGVCESDKDTVTVSVNGFPTIKVLNTPQRVCAGDGMYLLAEGGIRYEWTPETDIIYFNDSAYTRVKQPTTYVVKGYDAHGCVNTDSVTFDQIEQCCTFSYPDAFTPNHDGLNDGWSPLTYGNVDFYLLSVYNRWGQRVFITSNPGEHWDGTWNGKDAGTDTYYFYLRATCVTGHKESTKGSFVLIR